MKKVSEKLLLTQKIITKWIIVNKTPKRIMTIVHLVMLLIFVNGQIKLIQIKPMYKREESPMSNITSSQYALPEEYKIQFQ